MNGIIFIGPQASGKSTFYKENFLNTHIRLNLDMLKTRHREKIIFDACLKAKQPVVIDNTNPTIEDRQLYIEAFNQHNFEVIGYYFVSSFEECIQRNNLRTGKARIPEVGIKSTFKKMESPVLHEGFSKLFHVTLDNSAFKIETINS